jgi:sulfoxide reductase heme-binding subunit YedZ
MALVRTLKANWLRILVHLAALAPLVLLVWQYATGAFLIDPVLQITTRTGRTALRLLVLSLAATPLALLTGWSRLRRVRRALGLYAFLYAALHGLTFVGLDYRFDLELLGPAIRDQRFVLAGMATFLLLLPLALTSTRDWQRRLGKGWRWLHRLAYAAGLLAVVHFAWLTKDLRVPLRYGALLAVLLVLRLPPVRRAIRRLREQVGAWWARLRGGAQHSEAQGTQLARLPEAD